MRVRNASADDGSPASTTSSGPTHTLSKASSASVQTVEAHVAVDTGHAHAVGAEVDHDGADAPRTLRCPGNRHQTRHPPARWPPVE